MKLFTHPLCPFVQRVLIGLRVRRAEALFETQDVDLEAPAPAALLAINPTGSVPTLAFAPGDGFHESLVILEFLDSLEAPGPRLYGSDAKALGKAKVLVEQTSMRLLAPVMAVNYARGNAVALRKAVAGLPAAFEWLSAQLDSKGHAFLGGADLGAADCAAAPFLVRYNLMRNLRRDLPLPRAGTAAANYFDRVLAHPHVTATSPTFEAMAPVFEKYAEPEPTVRAIIGASRAVLPQPEEHCALLNQSLAASQPRTVQPEESPVWKVVRGEKGPHIQARFRLPSYGEAIAALEAITVLQETADHHSHFVLEGYHALEIQLCTHEPVWGLSEKDFLMARALSETLFRL